MRAWHDAQGRSPTKVLIPDSAHGTNPASVTLAGYEAIEAPSDARGLIDLEALRRQVDGDTAGLMLTNPNTLGLFETDIVAIARAIHEVQGLLYYDGANLNAILGEVRPGDMGFDIVHLNLHKTFATPHGGGGPGAGPVAVSERLAPFLPGPLPRPAPEDPDRFHWVTPDRSIGRIHGWHGNAMVLARAYAYILANGGDGLRRVAECAVLNARYLKERLRGVYDFPFDAPCMHEFVASSARLRKEHGVKALDLAKRLIEEGFHPPTMYFPLIVEEALMVEPTETESPQTVEALARALLLVAAEAEADGGRQPAPRLGPRPWGGWTRRPPPAGCDSSGPLRGRTPAWPTVVTPKPRSTPANPSRLKRGSAFPASRRRARTPLKEAGSIPIRTPRRNSPLRVRPRTRMTARPTPGRSGSPTPTRPRRRPHADPGPWLLSRRR